MPPHCTHFGFARGGSMLKWMDELAGFVSMKHAQGPAVTVGIEAINFHRMVKQGVFDITRNRIYGSYACDSRMHVIY